MGSMLNSVVKQVSMTANKLFIAFPIIMYKLTGKKNLKSKSFPSIYLLKHKGNAKRQKTTSTSPKTPFDYHHLITLSLF